MLPGDSRTIKRKRVEIGGVRHPILRGLHVVLRVSDPTAILIEKKCVRE